MPVGFTDEDIAERVVGRLPNVNKDEFLVEATKGKTRHGSRILFLLPESDTSDVVAAMRKEFNKVGTGRWGQRDWVPGWLVLCGGGSKLRLSLLSSWL